MAFSIRTRLTFWYTALLTVSLILFAATFSYTLSKLFMNRIDSQINSVANMMVHTVMNPRGEILLPRDFEIILERFFGVRTAGTFIQVIDQHGKIIGRSFNLQGASLPISEKTYTNAVKKITTFEVVPSFGSYPVRMVTKPIIFKKSEGLVAIVQVGTSLEFMQDIFGSLVYIFSIGIGVAVLVAAAVGTFLARKALRPVSEITLAARRIEAKSLNERIDVEMPDDEIGMLAITINEMIERLEKAFSRIKQFTADASHELKTPLTIMKGEVEMALRSKDDSEYLLETLESSLEEIDRMSDIVKNLLDLTKIEAEREVTPMLPVRVDKILTERFDAIKRVAESKGVELVMERNEELMVFGEPVRLGQLFSNLIDNAVKYTPAGGRVTVSNVKEGGLSVIRVSDTGVGIDKEDIPFLFDRFFRVDKARTGGIGGAGLGLSICQEIAESLKGAITVESRPDVGSTFKISLPLCDPQA